MEQEKNTKEKVLFCRMEVCTDHGEGGERTKMRTALSLSYVRKEEQKAQLHVFM
jgi:hypothetical protein